MKEEYFVIYVLFSCNSPWFGEACDQLCVHGTFNPAGSIPCVCEKGWAGLNCNAECSLHGEIVNGTCQCYTGYRGEVCNIWGCPGIGQDCSGHGECNREEHVCTCYNSWTGHADYKGHIDKSENGCDVPDCPGMPDCMGRGTCNDTFNPPLCRDCDPGWMGPACEEICDAKHGNQTPPNSGQCQCDACYTGKGCNVECNNKGTCVNGTHCQCNKFWIGDRCEEASCPGEGCSDHGDCNSPSHECTCDPGWLLPDCSMPDCGPGGCNEDHTAGTCNGTTGVPFCDCDTEQGWFGHHCEEKCENGTLLTTVSGGKCECDSSHTGNQCQYECSNRGFCDDKGQCQCIDRSGSNCEMAGCPGTDGHYSGHGTCLNMQCECDPGWSGDGCDTPTCLNNCSGSGQCVFNETLDASVCVCNPAYVGRGCSLPCINGSNLGDGKCTCNRPCDTGYLCEYVCSRHGTCDDDGKCVCDFFLGYKGDKCDIAGCPGWPDNCMGEDHGSCNTATGKCKCRPGWKGQGCQVPDCDCNNAPATCEQRDGDRKPRCYNCAPPYIGDKCQFMCHHGTENITTSECICDLCYTGADCELKCNGQGTCNNQTRTCDCDFHGEKGDFCDQKGCPGHKISCSGHGKCLPASGECKCNTGWTGDGCHIAQCQNNCSGRGNCLELDEPQCNCSPGCFGVDCSVCCYHGVIIPPDEKDPSTQRCECDPCFSGPDCSLECSGHGRCLVSGTCDCGYDGWGGELCEKAGCPSLPRMEGVECSGHGLCHFKSSSVIGTCSCRTFASGRWTGKGCWTAECKNNCSGRGHCDGSGPVPHCVQCYIGWMGDDCSTPCHGTQEPMDSGNCKCSSNCRTGPSCDLTCNGYGFCDNHTDICTCHDGTGYNSDGFWGDRCETKRCPGIRKSCSGHGKCIEGQCLCDDGWGINRTTCHVADCPGEPDCSGHGTCDGSGELPVCRCHTGYMGRQCENKYVRGWNRRKFNRH